MSKGQPKIGDTMEPFVLGNNPYMSKAERLSVHQRYILVHCTLYYELDTPVIEDDTYNLLAKNYEMETVTATDSDLKESEFGYCFEDFDASTGFDLFSKLSEEHQRYINRIAWSVVAIYQKERIIQGKIN